MQWFEKERDLISYSDIRKLFRKFDTFRDFKKSKYLRRNRETAVFKEGIYHIVGNSRIFHSIYYYKAGQVGEIWKLTFFFPL